MGWWNGREEVGKWRYLVGARERACFVSWDLYSREEIHNACLRNAN